MGLWNWIVTQTTGVDPAAEQARADALDAQLAAMNAPGGDYWNRLSAAGQATAATNLANQQAQSADIAGQINGAFVQGAQQGLQNELDLVSQVSGGINRVLDSVGLSVLKIVPWWAWIGGAIALFLYAGGGVWLKGRMARR